MKKLITILTILLFASCETTEPNRVISGVEVPEGYQLIECKVTCYSKNVKAIFLTDSGIEIQKLNTFNGKFYTEYKQINNCDSIWSVYVFDPEKFGDSVLISVNGKQIKSDRWVNQYQFMLN